MEQQIIGYYNEIANHYDRDRFANSYGIYVDRQERQILNKCLKGIDKDEILDLGCGTGRLLSYANFGLDASIEMGAIAKAKYPQKEVVFGNATKTEFEEQKFQVVFSLHMLMHLNPTIVEAVLAEIHRILRSGGRFIFDIPSQKRRNLVGYKAQNWHGANGLTLKDIVNFDDKKWKLKSYKGTLFFPIHRFPNFLRTIVFYLDVFLCRSFFKEYSSYLVIELIKL